MPVTIDEMTAEVAPPAGSAGPSSTGTAASPAAEPSPSQLCDQLERLEHRAARLQAD
ncbi:MAG TPA: hypothetical protein PLX89_09000 [Verrucomicrobiota bacterium]|nr:hypothetical protein [Verrucomicrobiota bacterium]